MTRKFFGTDGIRGLTNSEPMTAETALRVGQAAGAHFLRGDHRHRVVIGKDTRLVRLHDGIGAGRRLHQRRHGCRAAGADADAGGGDADAVDARRPRGDDLRLAQSVRRQWHQAVRARRLQAQRQGRAGDRAAAREGAEAGQAADDRPGQADRRCPRPLHPLRKVDFPRTFAARRPQDRRRLRQWRRLSRRARGAVGAWRGRRPDRRQRPTAPTSTTAAARPIRRRCRPSGGRRASRHRPRARRRRRPADRRRREGRHRSTATS